MCIYIYRYSCITCVCVLVWICAWSLNYAFRERREVRERESAFRNCVACAGNFRCSDLQDVSTLSTTLRQTHCQTLRALVQGELERHIWIDLAGKFQACRWKCTSLPLQETRAGPQPQPCIMDEHLPHAFTIWAWWMWCAGCLFFHRSWGFAKFFDPHIIAA